MNTAAPEIPTALDEVSPPARRPEVAREIAAMLERVRPASAALDFRDEPQDFTLARRRAQASGG